MVESVFSMNSAVATTKGTMGMAIAQAFKEGERGQAENLPGGVEQFVEIAYPAKFATRQ